MAIKNLLSLTQEERDKLAGIETGAEINNISDANATDLTDGGETTLHTHPGGTGVTSTDIDATSVITTSSTTDVLVTDMTSTPGAGNYLVLFASSWENSNSETMYVSIYANGVKNAGSEMKFYVDSSVPDSAHPVSTHATINGLGAGQAIEVKWRTTNSTAKMHTRKLTLVKIG